MLIDPRSSEKLLHVTYQDNEATLHFFTYSHNAYSQITEVKVMFDKIGLEYIIIT